MRATRLCLVVVALFVSAIAVAQPRSSKTLDVYVVDVEGGNATLFVAPSGESVLIDSGYAGTLWLVPGISAAAVAPVACRRRSHAGKARSLAHSFTPASTIS